MEYGIAMEDIAGAVVDVVAVVAGVAVVAVVAGEIKYYHVMQIETFFVKK